jgi:alanine racemase
VTAAGAERVRVDGQDEVEMLRREGIAGVQEGDPDIDAALLYGLPGVPTGTPGRPVMRLTGRVLSTKRLRPGDAVSYGYTFRTPTETAVALVTGGYAQGIVRALGNRADVEIDGVAVPIVGRVAMDVCVVDVGSLDVEPGAVVTYFGGAGPLRDGVARWTEVTGMTSGELVTVAGAHAVRGWDA